MATTPTRVRLRDFLLNPEIDERRLELIDGEVTEKAMPTWDHGQIAWEAGFLLRPFGRVSSEPRAVIEQAGASPVQDLAFYRFGNEIPAPYMTRPPTVAVEVLSPGQSMAFLFRKAALYLDFGVESVWVINPEKAEIHIVEAPGTRVLVGDDRITTPAVPGLDAPVASLFH